MSTIRARAGAWATLRAERPVEPLLCEVVAEDRRALLTAGDALAERASRHTSNGLEWPACRLCGADWPCASTLALAEWRRVTG